MDRSAGQVAEFLARLFERPAECTAKYSDEQLNQGLWFIADSSCSDDISTLLDESVTSELRERCIRSVATLFRELFSRRCSPILSSLNQANARPLNAVCYMWWDLLASATGPEDDLSLINEALCIEVMQAALSLPNIACQESALHGLAHWQEKFQQETREIIQEFLSSNSQISDDLRNYALKATTGQVQ